MFEINYIIIRLHLDMFIVICGLPDQYKNESWHKTDCCYVVSDL